MNRRGLIVALGMVVAFAFSAASAVAAEASLQVRLVSDTVTQFVLDGIPVVTHVAGDDATHRPYIKDLKAPSGIMVTRNHPPTGDDLADHPAMHPGLWLAYSDLGGRDFWRNKGPRVVQFARARQTTDAGFTVRNNYVDGETTIAREATTYTLFPRANGYLLTIDTSIEPLVDGLYFGDVEEMGLGLRVATGLSVKKGAGKIANSLGGENEKGTWGNVANWCGYAGKLGGAQVGVALMAHPANPTKTWFHSRDYGLIVANPFGTRAGLQGKMPIEKAEPVRMRFAVSVQEGGRAADPSGNYAAFAFADTPTTPAPAEPEGMTPIFDGKSLENWDGDPKLWSVKDGAIRGETTKENPAQGNTFIIWKGGTVKDFELRLKFRMNAENNSGIQYRSKHITDGNVKNKWVVRGYQAEARVDAETPGFIYDEGGKRARMCLVGEKATWENGKKNVTGSVGDPALIREALKPADWNDYVIIAKGNHIQHYINGVQTIDFTDADPQLALKEGILALQLHQGKPMWVEFKDVRVKRYE